VYKTQPILTHTRTPIKAPLLALPYGKPELSLTKSLEYGSLHQEAVKVFNVLLRLDEVRNPIPAVQVTQFIHYVFLSGLNTENAIMVGGANYLFLTS